LIKHHMFFVLRVIVFNQHSQPCSHLTIDHSLTRLFISYKKFIQWWSTTPLISTTWTITSHLNSLIINKDHGRWRWKSRFLLGTNTNVTWLNRIMESDHPNPPILEIGYQTTIHLKITCTDSLPLKKTTYCHKNE